MRVYTYIYLAHPLRDKSRKGVVGRPSHRVSAFLSRPCREKPLAPDAAYAENIAEVATHCPGVAVECSFADDGVISSYYTLWHRRGRPMKPKRMIPPLLPLSSSTPRCLASSSRALLFQSNYDFAISFPDHPLRFVDVVFRVPIVKLSLSLSSSSFSTRFLFIPFEISATESLLKWRGGPKSLCRKIVECAVTSRVWTKKKGSEIYSRWGSRIYLFNGQSAIGKFANNTRLLLGQAKIGTISLLERGFAVFEILFFNLCWIDSTERSTYFTVVRGEFFNGGKGGEEGVSFWEEMVFDKV